MILSSMVDLRVRGGIVPAHTGRLDKVASWVRYDLVMSTQVSESGQREEHRNQAIGLSRAATIALFLWFTIISLLITGYQHLYGGNHAYQLVLVQKLNDPTLYPNDPFADTVYHYASAFWYVIAWLSRFADLSAVLFVFFLLNKPLFLLAGFRLARTFFPDSRYAPVVGMAMMATFPQLLFGGGYVTDYTQQSSLSIATMLLALDAFLNKRWLSFAVWFGLAVNLNLMFSIFGATYVGVSWLIHLRRSYSADLLVRTVASILGGLIVGAPGIYLVRRATTHAEYDAPSVWQACELSYPYHYYPQLWEIPKQLLALLLVVGVIVAVYRFRNASPVGFHVAAWTGVAIGWYLVGWLNPLLLHSLPLLHLQPVRALVLWQLGSMVFLISFLLRLLENSGYKLNAVYSYLCGMLIVTITFINHFPYSRLFVGVAVVSVAVCEVTRRILQYRGVNLGAVFAVIFVVLFVSLHAAGHAARSVLRGKSIFSSVQHPASQVAEWARSATPKEAVFLIPIHDEGGWQRFRHLSQRNVFTQRKDGTAWSYAPWFADDWLERLRALGFFEVLAIDEKSFRIGSWIRIWSADEKNFILAYDKVDDDRVEALRRQYRIDYWITRANVKTRFPKVYEHEGWKVLKVSE